MDIGTADYGREPCGNAGRVPDGPRRCWAPGDQEHDHQMCEDTNTEGAIEDALNYAPADLRVAARRAIDSLIREARLSGLTAATDPGDVPGKG